MLGSSESGKAVAKNVELMRQSFTKYGSWGADDRLKVST